MIITIAIQYDWIGNINPAYLLGILLGTVIGWIIVSSPRSPWVYWLGMVFSILFVPVGVAGFIRLIALLFSFELPTQGIYALYLLGVVGMLFFYYRTIHFQIEGHANRPILDERYQYHFGVSSYWAFLFLNLWIIGALLQPWVPLSQLGLWIAILIGRKLLTKPTPVQTENHEICHEKQEAVAQLKHNELRGLDFLILRYQVRAVQAAYLISGDRAQAEDIAQSAFLKVVDKIGRFDERHPFGPWFLRIVTNLALRAAYRRYMEALGYIYPGPWIFTFAINP